MTFQGLFGEDQLTVNGDFESSPAAGNQANAGHLVECPDWSLKGANNGLRQTGGAGKVVSFGAKDDLNAHRL